MNVRLWGTRGSIATPGPETIRYGGNTTCVEVTAADGTTLVLDAGTGIRRLGATLMGKRRVDLFLTHLHMDHIQGLGFFAPLRRTDTEVHIWGPRSATLTLRQRLDRYLSPPLFPIRIRDMEANAHFHQVPDGIVQIGPFRVSAAFAIHPDHTVGYRIEEGGSVLAFLPDHEPALARESWLTGDWTSGCSLAADADLLIHDAQYAASEYRDRVGWGHSSMEDAFRFGKLARVRQLVIFHHDPGHTDDVLDRLIEQAVEAVNPPCAVHGGLEGQSFEI